MKRIALVIVFSVLVVTMAAGGAFAWDLCYKDTQFTPEYQVNVEGSIIRGQAILAGEPIFPAPITGVFSGGKAVFSVSYLDNSGLRFYVIDAFTGQGTTWGIYSENATYYDAPHSAQLASCASIATDGAGTGASRR